MANDSTERFIRLETLNYFHTHTRYLITLRSGKSTYKSLLLFRLAEVEVSSMREASTGSSVMGISIQDGRDLQMYAMEATCPHLGADLSHAEIEDCGDDIVAVCPWHRYDFDLRTGKSETGLRACVYGVRILYGQSNPEVWVEGPTEDHWELVELRPVSEAFADLPPPHQAVASSSDTATPTSLHTCPEPVVPVESPPGTLLEWAVLILNTSSSTLKVERTKHALSLFRNGKLKSLGRGASAPLPPDVPPRESTLQLVDPTKVARRGKGGSAKTRVAMLHALANIEQWAIDLAWDIIARFGNDSSLPHQFYTDFSRVALDESKHFTLLSQRLSELGTEYGSLPIHSALWSSAIETAQSLKARLAIIHLVHEARGLDVNPATIEKFRRAGDLDSVKVLEIIHLDEITHVTCGHRWFTWVCEKERIDPVDTFRKEVREKFNGAVRGPFNEADRAKAGMGREFYEDLIGEADARAKLGVGYESVVVS